MPNVQQPEMRRSGETRLVQDSDGPKPGGAYTVQLPSNQTSDVEAATSSLLARKDLVAAVLPGQ